MCLSGSRFYVTFLKPKGLGQQIFSFYPSSETEVSGVQNCGVKT